MNRERQNTFEGENGSVRLSPYVMNSSHLCSLVKALRVPHTINITISARVILL